jgi:hypothetical protein
MLTGKTGIDLMLKAKTILGTVVITVLAAALPARAQVIGDWVVDTKSQSAYSAVTVNDSGHTFGEFCDLEEGNCLWLIEMSSSCDEGAKTPVVANSDGSAANLELLCMGRLDGGNYAYAFTDFDRVDNLVRHSNRIGFAIPLGGDDFQMIKYDVHGAAAALSTMLAATNKDSKKSPPSKIRHNRV